MKTTSTTTHTIVAEKTIFARWLENFFLGPIGIELNLQSIGAHYKVKCPHQGRTLVITIERSPLGAMVTYDRFRLLLLFFFFWGGAVFGLGCMEEHGTYCVNFCHAGA